MASVDPEQAVKTDLMSDKVARSIGPERFVTALLGAFAAASLLLATLGIFGLVSYTTSQRTRELGIRMALGATPARVIGAVIREGVLLLAVGLGIGVLGALLVGRVLAERVAGAAAFDPLVFTAIFGVLLFGGTLASLLPALRAIRVEPSVALRYE